MASIATNTPTTPAMPMTMTDAEPRRWRSVLTPTAVTEAACLPERVSVIHAATNTATPSAAYQGRRVQMKMNTASRTIKPRLIRNRMWFS